MSDLNIIEAFEDKEIFGPLIKDQSTFTNWKVALKAIFGLPMTEKESLIYQEFTAREKTPGQPFKEIFLIIGRRGGKSFAAAIIAVFLAVFKDWRKYLRPGELGYIMCIAADRKQASVVLNYIRAILRRPLFKKLIESETKEEIRLINGIIISVVTCSYRTLRGYTVLAAVCDEIAFWRAEGASPAREILTALRPALATVPGSMLLSISTPYARTGPLYEIFRDKYGQDDPDVLVFKATSKAMNPTIKDKIITKAMKEDYAAAKAEWLAEFREDLETFLSMDIIEDSIIPGRWELPPVKGISYQAFTDPSGGSRGGDSFTLAITHQSNDKKIVADRTEERRPPFKPEDVVKEFAEILKSYEVDRVVGDRYAGTWPSSAFEKEGIIFEASEFDKSKLYLEFEPLMAQGLIELPDNERLRNQLANLERRTRSGGRGDRVDHPAGMNDDVSNAVAGSCVLSFREAGIGLGETIVLDEGPEMSEWEAQMIRQRGGLKEPKDDAEIGRLTTEATAKRYIELCREGYQSIDDIAKVMRIEPALLRKWVSLKRDFIDEISRSTREGEGEGILEV